MTKREKQLRFEPELHNEEVDRRSGPKLRTLETLLHSILSDFLNRV